MAAVVVMAYCHMTCSLAIASLHLGIFFWIVLNGSNLKCLDISVVFLGLFTSKVNSGVIVRIDRLAKVDGVLQLLAKHPLTRVSRHLQKKETGVGFRQVVVWGRVFVKHLKRKTRRILTLNNPFILLYVLVKLVLTEGKMGANHQCTGKRKLFTSILEIVCTDGMVNICEVVKIMSKCLLFVVVSALTTPSWFTGMPQTERHKYIN